MFNRFISKILYFKYVEENFPYLQLFYGIFLMQVFLGESRMSNFCYIDGGSYVERQIFMPLA